jgi:amidase
MLTRLQINAKIDRLRTLYAAKWNAEEIDCLLCPISPSVASVHDETLHWGYSCVFNVLDYPAAVLPVSSVRTTDVGDLSVLDSFGPLDEWYTQRYSPERYANAPTSIQIVGRRLQEEKLLGMASQIEDLLTASTRERCGAIIEDRTQRGKRQADMDRVYSVL